ncbi:Sensory transduction regulatory protein [Mariniradius saccharolyticus AK6]|uniref:Sensory transduction regulatory protein n=1 Tax=Mariniradius saccharolyticus AK6 TaxID=1239962 RepID=M7XLF9_9BACT|nr:response regulator [Mariniradius saccharolyticus]EMS35308.1 Sensory transduction regulatory protein [Mariniradius saccharolyticus AK6]
MRNPTRILIVEDDMIIAANISLQLSNLGYEVTGIETRGEDAVNHALENHPDIILMDINLKGKIDGIEAAKAIKKTWDIPLVYLTANTDDASFQKAKETHPFAFISKPFNKLNLERTIALVEEKVNEKRETESVPHQLIDGLEDRIFIRTNGKLVKVMLDEILYLEADRNYCHIYTKDQDYLIVNTLNIVCEKLTSKNFLRVHRSFVVNLKKLDAVADSYVEINNKVLPIGKIYKEDLMKNIQKV